MTESVEEFETLLRGAIIRQLEEAGIPAGSELHDLIVNTDPHNSSAATFLRMHPERMPFLSSSESAFPERKPLEH